MARGLAQAIGAAVGQVHVLGLGQAGVVAVYRPVVERIVVLTHHLTEHVGPGAGPGQGLPAFDGLAPAQHHQAVEQGAEGVRIVGKKAVVLQQQLLPGGMPLRDQHVGHLRAANLLAVTLDEYGPRGIQAAQRLPEARVELLLGLPRLAR